METKYILLITVYGIISQIANEVSAKPHHHGLHGGGFYPPPVSFIPSLPDSSPLLPSAYYPPPSSYIPPPLAFSPQLPPIQPIHVPQSKPICCPPPSVTIPNIIVALLPPTQKPLPCPCPPPAVIQPSPPPFPSPFIMPKPYPVYENNYCGGYPPCC